MISAAHPLRPILRRMEITRNTFVSLIGVLLGVGLLMVFSASITARPSAFEQVYLSRQVIFLAGAIVAAGICARLPASAWRRLAPWLFAVNLALLVLVLVPGVGTRVNGAQRWFRFGGISLQPSEFMKVTLPLFLAAWIDRRRNVLDHWWRGAAPIVPPVAATILLTMRQPDLGTGLFLGAIAAIALFVGGWPLRNFFAAAAVAGPSAAGLLMLHPYQVERLRGFFAAWTEFEQAPYQVRQSLTTLGTGGLQGVGLGSGQQKLSFLPEANTDFVFAVVGEELGLVGTLGLLAMWIGVFITGLHLLSAAPPRSFQRIAGYTLLTQLVLQAAINVAVVTAMAPTKGIAHPLISYGGSSLLASLTAMGVLVGLSRDDPRSAAQTPLCGIQTISDTPPR